MDRMLAHAIDTALVRMVRVYGAGFAAMWGATKHEELVDAFGMELGGFRHRLDAIAWACNHLPERCPNVAQFRNLCHQAPVTSPETMPMGEGSAPTRGPYPDEVEDMKALADGIRNGALFAKPGREWAERLMARDPSIPTRATREMAASVITEHQHGRNYSA